MINKVSRNDMRIARHKRVREKVSGTANMPRLNVFRSNKNIFAQIIDDEAAVTLVSASSIDKELKLENGSNIEAATKVGETIPSIFENFVIPGIQKGTDFITKNADTIVGAAGDVLITIAPPLAQAIGEVLPEVIKSLGKGLWNNATGKKSGITHIL